MDVKIVEAKTRNVVATYKIILSGPASDQDYCDEAWRAAVEDRTVDPARKKEYEFRLPS